MRFKLGRYYLVHEGVAQRYADGQIALEKLRALEAITLTPEMAAAANAALLSGKVRKAVHLIDVCETDLRRAAEIINA